MKGEVALLLRLFVSVWFLRSAWKTSPTYKPYQALLIYLDSPAVSPIPQNHSALEVNSPVYKGFA